MLVKLWVNGAEEEPIVGNSAAFGSVLPTNIRRASRLPAVYTQPSNGCLASSTKVFTPHSLHTFLGGYPKRNIVQVAS